MNDLIYIKPDGRISLSRLRPDQQAFIKSKNYTQE